MKYFRIISTLFVIGLGLSLIACSQTIKSLDKQFNRVKAEPPLFCSKDNPCQEAKQFHKTLFVADLHADSLLLGRDLIEKSDAGLVDIPRLIKGNVAIQVFGVVTRYSVQDIQSSGSTGSRNPSKINDGCGDDLITLRAKFPDWPKDTEKSLLARSLHQAAMLHTFEIRSEILTDRKYPIKQFRIIKSQMDLNEYLKARKSYPGITAGLLGLEGAHGLRRDLGCGDADNHVLQNVEILFNAGFRMIGLTHFFNTIFAGSAHGDGDEGLTPLGKQLIEKMGELHMILDLAHASPNAIEDTLKLIDQLKDNLKPVPALVVSHTGVHATCPGERNICGEHIRGIASRGGVIGIGFFKNAVCGYSVKDIVRAIRYVAELPGAGVEHVALGSDYDGFVATPMDASGLVQITAALMEEKERLTDGQVRPKFSREEIQKIIGENVLDLLQSALPPG